MDNWKIPAVVAGGAFALSFLIGLFSGALFGIILLRAFIFGIIGGGLALGVPIVADRYLPEVEESDESAPGSSVDIVLDQENPHTPGQEDFIQEVVEGPSGPKTDSEDVDSLPEDEGVSDLEAVDDGSGEAPSPPPATESRKSGPAPGSLSGLPSLDGFEDSFSASLPADESGGGPSFVGGFAETVDVDGMEQDPREIAKAVQTILKKDQEG